MATRLELRKKYFGTFSRLHPARLASRGCLDITWGGERKGGEGRGGEEVERGQK